MRVTFSFDPHCPFTWLTSRWLLRAAEEEDLEIEWSAISVAHLDRDRTDRPQWLIDAQESGRRAGRIARKLLDDGDVKAMLSFYDMYGTFAFREGRARTPDLACEAARAAGTDPAAVAAAHETGLDSAIENTTDMAVAAAGGGVGSPILQWNENGAAVAIWGPILGAVPDAGAAGDLWRGVRAVAGARGFCKLQRGATGDLDLAGS